MHPLEGELKIVSPFLCPELRLWLLPPEAPSWHASDPSSLGMPYWAFAWPGGQVLARFLFDHPEYVRGKRVLDFGSGCAIEGIAAARCGGRVSCADVDPLAGTMALRNAALNEVQVEVTHRDLIGAEVEADVILAGDVCYSPELAARLLPWLEAQSRRGVRVLVGDPLRVPGVLVGAKTLFQTDASFDGDPRGLTLWRSYVLELGEPLTPTVSPPGERETVGMVRP